MRALALAVLLAAALEGCHSLQGPRPNIPVVVEAEGWAPADPAGVERSRQKALAEAKRAAVEKAMGAKLSAVTRLNNSSEVEQLIVTRASGVVAKYKILSEGEVSGLYGVTIKAWVKSRGEDDDGPEAFLPPPGDPRVSVKAAAEGDYAKRSMDGLWQGLSGRGVTMVDGAGADLVVTVDAEVKELDNAGLEGLRSWRARAWAVARDAKTGAVVSQTSSEASAVDLVASSAAGLAAERAGVAAGQSLAKNLDESLQSR